MSQGRREKILILEDNSLFKRALCEFMKEEGISICEAETLSSAIAYLDQEGDSFFLALIDLGLTGPPGENNTSGLDLVREIVRRNLKIECWIMSGDIPEEIRETLSAYPIQRILLKPIANLRKLAKEIRHLQEHPRL